MSKPSTPMWTRFWQKVVKTDECWNWVGCLDGHGYGQIYDRDQRHRKAHRVSYEFAHGAIPEGLHIDHTCHNRGCVNPDHLQAVTNKANIENRRGANRNNLSSGVRGVSWHKAAMKWSVSVTHNRVAHYGGLFVDLADAERAASQLRAVLLTNSLADLRSPK